MRVVNLDQESEQSRLTVLSYGAMRAGKTRFSSSWPRPLFFSDNTESGWKTISNMDPQAWYEPTRKPAVWAIEKASDMAQMIGDVSTELAKDPLKYRTIVVDSLTFYSDLYFNSLYGSASAGGRSPDLRQIYGQLGNHLRDIRIRLHSLPVNIIWTALEKSPGDENPFGGPMIPGQASQKFAAGVDYILFHRVFQPNPSLGPQFEIRTRQWGGYRAGGRDEGRLPDPLSDCSYRALEEALHLPNPFANGNGHKVATAPVSRPVVTQRPAARPVQVTR